MSHEITIREDGFAEAAFALTPAWHGLGTVLDHHMTSAEAMEKAGLDWQVLQEPVYRKRDTVTGPKFREVSEAFLNVRSDISGPAGELGFVTDHYQVVQNTEAFKFLDSLVEDNKMRYESAFSLRGGKTVCMLALMPGAHEVAKGDHLLDYIMLSMAHDGTGAIHFGPTSVRVVCANTHRLAIGGKGIKRLSINHKGNIQQKLEEAKEILLLAGEKLENHSAIAKRLAEHKITGKEWAHYLDLMCPLLDPMDPDFTERRNNAVLETRMSIQDCFRNERQALAANTAWAAYNAITEHIDHLPRRGRGRRRAEARFNTTLYGMGQDMKERALQGACRMADIQYAI